MLLAASACWAGLVKDVAGCLKPLRSSSGRNLPPLLKLQRTAFHGPTPSPTPLRAEVVRLHPGVPCDRLIEGWLDGEDSVRQPRVIVGLRQVD